MILKKNEKSLMKWKLAKPKAATLEEIDEWEKKNIKQSPIRYFLQEKFPSLTIKVFDVLFYNPIHGTVWWFTHNFISKYKFHIIKPRTLEPMYHSQDVRILHSVMECLSEYIDDARYTNIDLECSDFKTSYDDMYAVYQWWCDDWPMHENKTPDGKLLAAVPKFPPEWGDMPYLKTQYRKEPLVLEWIEAMHQRQINKDDWYEKETVMISRVIKARKFLWYS